MSNEERKEMVQNDSQFFTYDIASRVLYNLNHPGQEHTKKAEVFVDPATIGLIVEAIIGVVKLIQSCRKTPEEAVKVAFEVDKPEESEYIEDIEDTRRNRRLLRRTIRRKIGWWEWWKRGNEITSAIVKTGKYMSPEETGKLMQESDRYV